VALFAPDVMAGANGADFFARHPDALTDPAARTLHLAGRRGPRAIT
jgi:hypothetical protein